MAYARLAAGTGALLLFGTVQVAMILWGLLCGERLSAIGGQLGYVSLGLTALAAGVGAPVRNRCIEGSPWTIRMEH